MKKRIIPLFFLVLLLATVMIPTSAATSCKKYSPNVRLYHIQTALGEYFF